MRSRRRSAGWQRAVLLAVAGLVCCAVAAAGQELLQNPGFEGGASSVPSAKGSAKIGGSIANNWVENSAWSPGNELTYSLGSGARTGSGALCVTVKSGFAQFGQFFKLPAGKAYALSIWAKSSTKGASVRLNMQLDEEPFTSFGSAAATPDPSSGWVQLSIPEVRLPSGSSGQVPVAVLVYADKPGTICVDDASLKENAQAAPVAEGELLFNPNFEGASSALASPSSSIGGVMADRWVDNSDFLPGAQLRYSLDGDARQSGSRSLRLEVLGGSAQMAQWVDLPAGKTFKLSVWARAQGGQAPVTLSLRLNAAPYTTFASASALVGDSWTQIVVPAAAVPPSASGGSTVRCGFMVNTGSFKGTLWLDSASLVQSQGAPSTKLSTPSRAIPRDLFCLNTKHIHRVQWLPQYAGYDWPAVDFGIWRTWDSYVTWNNIQPGIRGQFDWTNLDKHIAEAKKRGQKVIFTLGQTPLWATSDSAPSVYGEGRGSPPADIEDWKTFVRELAKRYKGAITAYEVWNEPDLQGKDGFYNGSPEKLAELAKAAQDALADADPGAVLLTPPMSKLSGDALGFLSRYMAKAKQLGVKHGGVAVHTYNSAPELDPESVAAARAVASQAGLPTDLPVYNTEVGLLEPAYAATGRNQTLAAGFLLRTYLLNWGLGVDVVCWYAYDDVRVEGLTLTTATSQQAGKLNKVGQAYQRAVDWLVGARMVSLERDAQGVWVAALERDGKRFWIVWNGDAGSKSKEFDVPDSWDARYRQGFASGEVKQLPSGPKTLLATEVPVLIGQ